MPRDKPFSPLDKFVSVGKASKALGVAIETLRLWEKKGLLIPERTPAGHRRYKLSQLESFDHQKHQRQPETAVFIYARVSTQKQADSGNLDRQIGRLAEYAIAQGHTIQNVFKDVVSGLNESRRGLEKLIQAVRENANSKIIIECKDRLARFGYSYLERHFADLNGQVLIVEGKTSDEQQELVEDLIAITTSFSARIYGKRGGRVAKKLAEAIELEVGKPDEDDGQR